MNDEEQKAALNLQIASEYTLKAVPNLAQVEQGQSSGAEYILCSAAELRALVSEIKRLHKEVAYLQEALLFEERQTVGFRREHDCY